MFMTTMLTHRDSKGTQYSVDIGASGDYASEVGTDVKILSDLNPGISTKEVDVFEISEELFEKGGWIILIDADQDKYILVN